MTVNYDQAIFDAIAAATSTGGQMPVIIDTQKFIETFNSHRDRKLCVSLLSSRELALERAAQAFIDKVDAGEARSNASYMAFKRALKGES